MIHRRTKDPTPTQPCPKSYTYVSILSLCVPGWISDIERGGRGTGALQEARKEEKRKEGRRKERKKRNKERRKEKGRGGDERGVNEGIKVGTIL